MMTPTFLRLVLITAFAAPACVVSDGDDDDGEEGGGTDDPSASTTVGTSASASASGSADESGEESGADVGPAEGLWQYEESGAGTNNCTFLDDPSNGFGQFQIAITGAGTLTITPGDDTDPFQCTYGDGSYACAERLTGMTDEIEGVDAMGNILVAVAGTIESETEITGTQNGRIECVGADCGVAEAALGVTFPCTFTVPFVGEAL